MGANYLNKGLSGLAQLQQGWQLLKTARLMHFVILPITTGCLLFGLAALYAVPALQHADLFLEQWLPHWIAWLLSFGLLLIGTVLIFYACMQLILLISSPFNSLLAEKIVFHLTGHYPASQRDTFVDSMKQLPRCLWREYLKFGYFFPRLLLVFLTGFIPILQMSTPVTGFLLSAWSTALNYLDYAYDNDHRSFASLRHDAQIERSQLLSFGSTVMLASFIPIINLLLIPTAVASGTVIALELQSQQSTVKPPK